MIFFKGETEKNSNKIFKSNPTFLLLNLLLVYKVLKNVFKKA